MVRKGVLDAAVFQTPDFDGVKGIVRLSLRAEIVLVIAIPGAIIPQIDSVVVLQVSRAFGRSK